MQGENCRRSRQGIFRVRILVDSDQLHGFKDQAAVHFFADNASIELLIDENIAAAQGAVTEDLGGLARGGRTVEALPAEPEHSCTTGHMLRRAADRAGVGLADRLGVGQEGGGKNVGDIDLMDTGQDGFAGFVQDLPHRKAQCSGIAGEQLVIDRVQGQKVPLARFWVIFIRKGAVCTFPELYFVQKPGA